MRGLIPAHAGKTGNVGAMVGERRAHPRSRGENDVADEVAHEGRGSSPLTRGKRAHDTRFRRAVGLIPAHAGKTTQPTAATDKNGAHPRSRGENACAPASRIELRGSSPLTRGKRDHSLPQRLITGLIPAHAGKTASSCQPATLDSAHPRSRGENNTRGVSTARHPGSSPLTRGKPWRGRCEQVGRGLIPAHAGKTERDDWPVGYSWAHPRSRGENVYAAQSAVDAMGSSPLTRGKRRGCARHVRPVGLIPAHAGKTWRFTAR